MKENTGQKEKSRNRYGFNQQTQWGKTKQNRTYKLYKIESSCRVTRDKIKHFETSLNLSESIVIPMAFPWHSHGIPCLLCPSRTWAVRTTMDIVLDHWPHCLTSSVKHKRRMWPLGTRCPSAISAQALHPTCTRVARTVCFILLRCSVRCGTLLRFKTSTTRSFLVQSLVPFLMFGSLENSNF